MDDTKDDKDNSPQTDPTDAVVGQGGMGVSPETTVDDSPATDPVDKAESMVEPVPPSQQDIVTKAVKKTLQDIEQDIDKGDFDLSDVRAFGDHDSPEVDTIDISQDAQSVLDKIQNQMGIPQQVVPDPAPSDFVMENGDKFKQAVQDQTTQFQPSPAPKDDTNLSFDFDIEHIQAIQSPVRRSLLAMVFHFTVFVILLVGGFGVVYYLYTEKLQVQINAPVVLKAQQDIKVKPTTQTGMKIENLDKEIYGLLDKKDLENSVLRIRPLPEQPLPSAEILKQNTVGQNMDEQGEYASAKKSAVEIAKTEKTESNRGEQVEKLTLATPKTQKSKIPENKTFENKVSEIKQDVQQQAVVEKLETEKSTVIEESEPEQPVSEKPVTEQKMTQTDTASIAKMDTKKQVTMAQITKAKKPKTHNNTQNTSLIPLPPDEKKAVEKKAVEKKTVQKTDLPFTVSDATDKQNLGWRVQVAALTNMQDAHNTYNAVQKKHTFLQQIPFHVEKAIVKNKMYYRLQAIHLTDKASAIALCGQIKKAQGRCIVKK